jgi:hypothetical protein
VLVLVLVLRLLLLLLLLSLGVLLTPRADCCRDVRRGHCNVTQQAWFKATLLSRPGSKQHYSAGLVQSKSGTQEQE